MQGCLFFFGQVYQVLQVVLLGLLLVLVSLDLIIDLDFSCFGVVCVQYREKCFLLLLFRVGWLMNSLFLLFSVLGLKIMYRLSILGLVVSVVCIWWVRFLCRLQVSRKCFCVWLWRNRICWEKFLLYWKVFMKQCWMCNVCNFLWVFRCRCVDLLSICVLVFFISMLLCCMWQIERLISKVIMLSRQSFVSRVIFYWMDRW